MILKCLKDIEFTNVCGFASAKVFLYSNLIAVDVNNGICPYKIFQGTNIYFVRGINNPPLENLPITLSNK